MAVDLCYVVSHGFAARMILHSGIIPALKERGISVAIATPNAGEEDAIAFADLYGIELLQTPEVRSLRTVFHGRLRPYLYEDVVANPALRAKHERALAQTGSHPWHWLRPRLYMALNRLAVRSTALGRMFNWMEQALLHNDEVAELLHQVEPRLVVSTYPVAPIEAVFLLEAGRAGVPTVGHLLSWDNVTAKGRFTVLPDYYVAWGSIMQAELAEYYDVPSKRVIEAGVAHFDAHVNEVEPDLQRRLLVDLHLDPQKPYLFFGMSSPYFAPHEIDIVEWLSRQVRADTFGPEMQLLIRPHPQNVRGNMADERWLPRLEALRSDRVGINYPIVKESRLQWNMDKRDLTKLVNLLAGCALCLNSGSTLSIDAIIHDKPVVLTLFDADKRLPWWQSVRRVAEYYHIEKLINLGGVRIARSFDELKDTIRLYLSNPAADRSGRKAVVHRELGVCDGRASVRVAEALAKFVNTVKVGRNDGSDF